MRDGTRDHEDEEEGKGANVDGPAAEELSHRPRALALGSTALARQCHDGTVTGKDGTCLGQGTQNHWAGAQTCDKHAEPERAYKPRGAKFGHQLTVGAGI